MKVGIVILNYITYQLTLSLVMGLQQKLRYCNYQIIVVDNNSPNESAEELKENLDESVILITSDVNGGYASGNNLGIKFAIEQGAEFIFILNNDVEIKDSHIINKLILSMSKNENIAGVCPRIYDIQGKEVGQYIKRRENVLDYTLLYDFLYLYEYYLTNKNNKDFDIYRMHGCAMFLKVAALSQVGLLDERTFLYGEEAILAEKLKLSEYKIVCCNDGKVIHNHSSTISSNVNASNVSKYAEESRKIYLGEYRHFNSRSISVINGYFRLRYKVRAYIKKIMIR